MRLIKLFLTLAAFLFSNIAYANCTPAKSAGTHQAKFSKYSLSYRTEPVRIKVSEHFVMFIDVCDASGAPFSGDLVANAHMPKHKHGMNYMPKIIKLKDGEYRADGFMFHMPGHWQFKFDIQENDRSERLTMDQKIK